MDSCAAELLLFDIKHVELRSVGPITPRLLLKPVGNALSARPKVNSQEGTENLN